MAQRLPQPGGDGGDWGDILNAYLGVSLASNGTLNPGVVTNTQLDTPTQTAIAAISSKYVKPSSGIPSTDLDSATQANLTKASSSVQLAGDLGGTTTAPTVAKLQGVTLTPGTPANNQVLTYSSSSGGQWIPSTVSSNTVNNATTSTPGIVQLSGDLAGSATSPVVAKLNGGIVLPGSAPSASGQVLTTTSSGASATTSWTTPAAGVTLDSTAGDIAALASSANAGSSSMAAKADHVHPTTGLVTTTTSLGGDLSGTAGAATVVKVNGITVTGTPSANQVLTASSSTAANWTTPASSGAQALAPTAVKTSAYTASAGDFIPVDASGGAVTITLPTAPSDKTRVEIKMINTAVNASNGYGNNVVTFTTGGSDVINKTGTTSGTLALLNQAITLQYTAATSIWYVQSDDLPLSAIVSGLSHTVTSTYTLTSTDHVVVADATSAAFTITLPTAVGFSGRYTIDAVTSTTNIVTLNTTSSQTIDGTSTTTLGTGASGAYWSTVDLISDGANWHVV